MTIELRPNTEALKAQQKLNQSIKSKTKLSETRKEVADNQAKGSAEKLAELQKNG